MNFWVASYFLGGGRKGQTAPTMVIWAKPNFLHISPVDTGCYHDLRYLFVSISANTMFYKTISSCFEFMLSCQDTLLAEHPTGGTPHWRGTLFLGKSGRKFCPMVKNYSSEVVNWKITYLLFMRDYPSLLSPVNTCIFLPSNFFNSAAFVRVFCWCQYVNFFRLPSLWV